MTSKYSIGPLHLEFSWSFEWRTRRHDRIFRVVDAYCRQNLNTGQLGVVTPIIEAALVDHCRCGAFGLRSKKELASVIRELQRRGYGKCLHEDLIAPGELWEFFQWELQNALWASHKNTSNEDVPHKLPPFAEPADFYFEVYRWRNAGRWP